jgi:dolichol-phosphate mannosyltransferase
MKIFVVPATYNEKENIDKFITVLEEEVFPKIKNHEMHIIVADDFSPDGTGEIVKGLMGKYKNLDINQGEKKGLGAAYMRTMGYAVKELGADVVVSIDADFQFDPHDLIKFVEKIDEGCDMVIQTRYSKGGSIPENWPPQRKVFSIVANLFVKTVFMKFSVHDWTGGFRAIKKEVFLKVSPEMEKYNGYIFQIAFLHKAVNDGFKIGEVPLHFSDRKLGMSKIAPLGYIIDVLSFVIVTRIKELITGSFGKFLVVGGTGFIIQLVIFNVFIKYTSLPLALGNWIAAQPAIFSNFNINNLWTFKEDRTKNFSSYLVKIAGFFLTSNIGVLLIQTAIIFVLNLFFGRRYANIYFIFATAVLLIYNFTVYRLVIWRKKPHK